MGPQPERFVPRERLALRLVFLHARLFLYDLSDRHSLPAWRIAAGLGVEILPMASPSRRALPAEPAQLASRCRWRSHRSYANSSPSYREHDFAETEVDSRQINLNPLSTFLPRKRSFFLEGSNQYDFGLGLVVNLLNSFLLQSQHWPSRRRANSHTAGVKLNGRVGKWNLALRRANRDSSSRRKSLPTCRSPPIAYPAQISRWRVSYDFNENLRVGTFSRTAIPRIPQHTLLGLDAIWRTSKFLGNKNLLVGGWTAATQATLARQQTRLGVQSRLSQRLLDCAPASINMAKRSIRSSAFFPARHRHTDVGCAFQPRPQRTARSNDSSGIFRK